MWDKRFDFGELMLSLDLLKSIRSVLLSFQNILLCISNTSVSLNNFKITFIVAGTALNLAL
jgi:hypothetical protein